MELKHAYLIIAYKIDLVLLGLLSQIDDHRNDIYIHFDAKFDNYDKNLILDSVHHSKVEILQKIKVHWGGYSQIRVELELLKAATRGGRYSYYHLLSGQDLAIKSQDYIHKFFYENRGMNYIGFENGEEPCSERIRYYYPFQDLIDRKPKQFAKKTMFRMQKVLLLLQKKMKIRRNKSFRVYKGCNWFSISDELAKYIIDYEPEIQKRFSFSFCADEIFIQSMMMNSDRKWKWYKEAHDSTEGSMRLIDWDRGNPYIFTKEDFEKITQSKMLFARKFSEDRDTAIIQQVLLYTKNQ